MLDKTALEQRTSMVIDQFEGIVPQYEAFYIHSIIYAADRANEAFNRFDTVISEVHPNSQTVFQPVPPQYLPRPEWLGGRD